ncbi:hypothetical protein Tco_0330952 [Tanacetum coccineum]
MAARWSAGGPGWRGGGGGLRGVVGRCRETRGVKRGIAGRSGGGGDEGQERRAEQRGGAISASGESRRVSSWRRKRPKGERRARGRSRGQGINGGPSSSVAGGGAAWPAMQAGGQGRGRVLSPCHTPWSPWWGGLSLPRPVRGADDRDCKSPDWGRTEAAQDGEKEGSPQSPGRADSATPRHNRGGGGGKAHAHWQTLDVTGHFPTAARHGERHTKTAGVAERMQEKRDQGLAIKEKKQQPGTNRTPPSATSGGER